MPTFHYKAATTTGEVVEGEMQAASREAVVRRLRDQGHLPIRAEERAGTGRARGAAFRLLAPRRVSRREIEVFTLELATLLEAGLPLDQALDILGDLAESDPARALYGDVHRAVRGGADLSEAMAAQPGVFSPFYVNMVRAGEAGGVVEATLARLADFLARSRELRESLVSSLVYPVILVFVALLSLAMILGFVVPRFSEMFAEAGQELPLATQVVVAAGNLVQSWGWAVALALIAGYLWLRRELADPVARVAWDRRLLAAPLAGDLVAKVETARFTRTLGTLLANGVPLLGAVSIAREILGNRVIADGVARIAEQVREGRGLAGPLVEADVFPRLVTHMLRVGEETGSLETMLLRLADIYDREVEATLRRLVAVLEPALILGLGVLVGGIILSIVMAILRVNELGVL